MVVPSNLNDSTAVTVLFMMVSGGSAGGGGFILKPTIISTVLSVLSSRGLIYKMLHGNQHDELQVVKTAPDSQLLNLMCVRRLITVLDEADQCGVICKL